MKHSGEAAVFEVQSGSIAQRLGIQPGDRIISINGRAVKDLIDLLILSSDETVTVQWQSSDGRVHQRSAKKNEQEGLGLSFEQAVFDGIRPCRNRCVFCFVDQLPRGMRQSLYIKDDDYRLSFLQGAYITLSNLREEDWERIFRFRLSPLYVSVHATDPEVRGRLLGLRRPAPVLPDLARLTDHGILVHCQVVTCPGINDGPVLERTIRELSALYPGVASLAVVPVGLTGHRLGLAEVRPVEESEAAETLRLVHGWQERLLSGLGTRFVFAADEWYLTAGLPLPSEEEYEDFPQISNGVGLLRVFKSEFAAGESLLPPSVRMGGRLLLVTGKAFQKVLGDAVKRLGHIRGMNAEVLPIENRHFGPRVDVAGLVVGADVLEALRRAGAGSGDTVFVPDIMMRSGEVRFLDDMTPRDLAEETGAGVRVIPATAGGLIEAIRDFEGGEP